MNKIIHWIAHLFGWNMGSVVTKYDADGVLWVAFKCDMCGVYQSKGIASCEIMRLKA